MSIDVVAGSPAIAGELPIKLPGGSQSADAAALKQLSREVSEAVKQSNESEVRGAARSLDEVLTGYNISLKFSRDAETGRTVIELVDYQSGETLRQMPSEVSLHLTAMFGKLQGRLFNRQA